MCYARTSQAYQCAPYPDTNSILRCRSPGPAPPGLEVARPPVAASTTASRMGCPARCSCIIAMTGASGNSSTMAYERGWVCI